MMDKESTLIRLVTCVVLLAGLVLWPLFAVGSGTEFMADILVFSILAIGLYVQIGLLGMVNFGFSIFFGVGGYVAAIFMMKVTPALLPSLGAVIGCVAIVALALGILARKAAGIAFMMITLTFSQLFYVIAVADDKWTNGVNGLTGVPRPKLPNWIVTRLDVSLSSDVEFYYFALFMFIVILLAVWLIQRSRLGAIFSGIRQNEERMVVLGYSVHSYKLAGFIISGIIGGIAGYLNVALFGYAGPGALFWTLTGEAILMVILGGASSLAGPVVGAALFIGLSHYAVTITDHWRLIVGIVFIVIVLYAPEGLVEIVWHRLVRRRINHEDSFEEKKVDLIRAKPEEA